MIHCISCIKPLKSNQIIYSNKLEAKRHQTSKMVDTVSTETRSRIMASIHGKNTKPELLMRKALHSAGFRFRIHRKDLPGKPDIVLPKYRAVIFVHGCFWHGHNCLLFKSPKTRVDYWKEKINRNRNNDKKVTQALLESGWRVGIVWECAMSHNSRDIGDITKRFAIWLRGNEPFIEET